MKKKIVLFVSLLLVSITLMACGKNSDNAEDYPKKAIEILIPYNAGGQTDISARIYAEHLKKYLDTDIVIINQTGGGGAVAINEVATSNADGYKVLLHHDAMHVGHSVGQLEQTYEDLTPIDTGARVNQAFVVSADAPWDNLDEFVADAKENPDKYIYAADIGGTTHFMGGMLTETAGIDLKMQDTGDESERMTALLGGHADVAVTSVSNAVSYVESGEYKVLAVLTEERDELAPDFPTAKEQDFDIVFSVTNVLYGPKDLPDNVVDAWNKATEKLIEDEEYQAAIQDIDMSHDENLDSDQTAEFVSESFNAMIELGEELGY